jgi:nucleoside-diphosphate-sugar epimerase
MTPPKTIAVTGATGFIGSALVRRFIERGFPVVGLARTVPALSSTGITWRVFDLQSESVPPELLKGVDVLIHAAMQIRSAEDDAIATNVQGTRNLLASAQACGVRQRVLLSSFSAHSDARSAYGRQKHLLEALFTGPGDAIVRPGLVIGNGGLFQRLADDLRTRRIVPLIDGGPQPLQTVHIDDLCAALERIVTHELNGAFNLAEPNALSYKAFYTELCARLNVAPLFLPIPFALAHLIVTLGSTLRLPMPIGPDNLLGLKAMRSRETNTDIERLGISVRDTRASLEQFAGLLSEAPRPEVHYSA